ncbi:SLATT domain-containing protein [Peterkaempfera bronchialis]|uniref:SLATT domain-containing protein n=1 Tax=Peterkaempfera bronchialis TaxID=2126346 RepID=UPI003C301ADE
MRRASVVLTLSTFLTGSCWTVLGWETPAHFAKPDIICGLLFALALVARVWAAVHGTVRVPTTRAEATSASSPLPPPMRQASVEDDLVDAQEQLRNLNARIQPGLAQRRSLYREDVADYIEQHQADSRRYRRTHNTLQSLIMIGSATTTTVGALDSGGQPTWQSLTIVGVSFAITLAAMFTGYYKYRERAYFLQQTADSIEEEVNAAALGIGAYKDFGPGEENKLMALFTQRVEDLRNEQRRRQQQLDQPADQAQQAAAPASP